MVHGREPRVSVDLILQSSEPVTSEHDYVRQLVESLRAAFSKVATRQVRAREINRLYRDKKEGRVDVEFKPGDSVLVWGPTTSGAQHPSTPKLLCTDGAPLT